MERQLKQTRQADVDSPGTSSGDRRHHPSPPVRSPEDSPPKSSISSLSSLSHGFSPERDEVQLEEVQGPPGSPPLDPLPNLSHPKPPSPPPPAPARAPVPMVNRYVRDEPVPMTMADRGAQEGFVGRPPEKPRAGGASGVDGGRRSRPSVGVVSTTEKEEAVKKAALGFRIFELLFCLVSLSVMAADKNQGWALDSFYRYKEFRYCMAVNVIGFAYAALQGGDLAYQLATKNYHNRRHPLRYYFDFGVDQILTYLLISAGSSAATRVDDWKSNWGPDKFPEMATASVGLAFTAFVAFAFSSLISGYLLYTSKSI